MKKYILLIVFLIPFINTYSQQDTVTIAGKAGGNITVEEIINNNILILSDSTTNVVMFQVSMVGGDVFTDFLNMGNTFPAEQILIIKTLPPKSVIYIKEIKMRDINNNILEAPDLKFVIIE